MAARAEAGRLAVTFRDEPRRLLLHGHCHQKALVGTGPARAALSLPPGYIVEEVDSGCCGMAGSFGYEAEHYDLSMAMAERRLLLAVRACRTHTIIVAAGVSCRQQIAHGSGRQALPSGPGPAGGPGIARSRFRLQSWATRPQSESCPVRRRCGCLRGVD